MRKIWIKDVQTTVFLGIVIIRWWRCYPKHALDKDKWMFVRSDWFLCDSTDRWHHVRPEELKNLVSYTLPTQRRT